MEPAPHPSATRRIGAPKDWDPARDGECSALEVADVIDPQSGLPFMESLWRPTAEELAALNAGACFILGISGRIHPVIYCAVSQPPRHDPAPEPSLPPAPSADEIVIAPRPAPCPAARAEAAAAVVAAAKRQEREGPLDR